VWQHLSLAGQIPGQLTGGLASNTYDDPLVPGVSAPAGPVGGTYWTMAYGGNYAPLGLTALFIGLYTGTSDVPPGGSFLTLEQAYLLDSKYDDGMPYGGSIQTVLQTNGYPPCCASSNTQYTWASSPSYWSTRGYETCMVLFVTRFE
jgi:hypothetical protein